jgi:hypothetical protein
MRAALSGSLYLGFECISINTSIACCPVWVKFGKSLSAHNTFSIGKFWKIGKGSTFLLGINEMMFRHAK